MACRRPNTNLSSHNDRMRDQGRDYFNNVSAELRRTYVATQFAMAGLCELVRKSKGAVAPENPDPKIYIGQTTPGDPGSHLYSYVTLSELTAAANPGGTTASTLSQQWIVSSFHAWEDNHRPAFARMCGVDTNDILSPIMGDLRNLRNDIIHHHGIASTANTGKNTLLMFEAGATVGCDASQFDQLIKNFTVEVRS